MGIGMALFEHTSYDPQNGAPINSNLADYVMAVNADVPPIDVHFLDFPDTEINELGARGIGEIGLAGVAAAVTRRSTTRRIRGANCRSRLRICSSNFVPCVPPRSLPRPPTLVLIGRIGSCVPWQFIAAALAPHSPGPVGTY